MRLVSLNVALFETNNDKLSKFLSNQKFDIVCLQEIAQKVDLSVNPVYISKSVIDKDTHNLKYSLKR